MASEEATGATVAGTEVPSGAAAAEAPKVVIKRRKKKSKTPKNPMPFVTPRDADILKILSSGVHTAPQIRHELRKFVAKNPKAADDKGDGFVRDMSMKALQIRICRLKKGKYIASKLYPEINGKGTFAGYVVGSAGKNYLINVLKYNPKHVRDNLPPRDHMSHELQIVSIVEAIKREGARGGFKYDIEDEDWLKMETGGAQKDVPYPDLYVRLTFDAGGKPEKRHLAFELDNGATHPRVVAEKAHRMYEYNNRRWLNAILCPNPARIDQIRAAFVQYIKEEKAKTRDARVSQELDKLYNRAFFTTTYGFLEKGIINTHWQKIVEGTLTAVPEGFESKKPAT